MQNTLATNGDISEGKIDCTLTSPALNLSYDVLAHIFLFRRDNMQFWFARIDVPSDCGINFPDDKKIKLVMPDGTYGWCYESSQRVSMTSEGQILILDVAGVGKFPYQPSN